MRTRSGEAVERDSGSHGQHRCAADERREGQRLPRASNARQNGGPEGKPYDRSRRRDGMARREEDVEESDAERGKKQRLERDARRDPEEALEEIHRGGEERGDHRHQDRGHERPQDGARRREEHRHRHGAGRGVLEPESPRELGADRDEHAVQDDRYPFGFWMLGAEPRSQVAPEDVHAPPAEDEGRRSEEKKERKDEEAPRHDACGDAGRDPHPPLKGRDSGDVAIGHAREHRCADDPIPNLGPEARALGGRARG